uniref:Uncharacterized protein n=1 Tax=Cannabis sativa TaxID=3483 RepID=A0A803R7R1_CANSA
MKSIIVVMMMTTMVVGCLGRIMDVAIFMNPTPNRCYIPGEYCAHIELKDCCEGLTCEGGAFSGTCVPVSHCISEIGAVCGAGIGAPPCCYPNTCHVEGFWTINGHCAAPNTLPASE